MSDIAFLVDTDVISASAPTKAAPDHRFRDWLVEHGRSLFVSLVSLAEIRRGISLVSGKGHYRKATLLTEWQESVLTEFRNRVVPVDAAVAQRAGDFFGRAEAEGHNAGWPDALIAATASCYGMTVVTGNGRHFAPFGVLSLNLREGR